MVSTKELYQLYLQSPLIVTDTRVQLKDCLFFCLKGSNFDGNQFASAALEQGARYAVIDDPGLQHIKGTLLVEDVLTSLQELASYHRTQLNIPIIGITGTNGKTTTKELTTAVLSKKFRVTSTKGNLNNHIGVPLTLLSINQDTELAIIEMGANHPGEIAELCKIAQPTTGIITNIGKAHLEGFGSIENIIDTKTALYRSVQQNGGTVFVNAQNETLLTKSKGIPSFTYGEGKDSNIIGKLVACDPYISVNWGDNLQHTTKTHLAGAWNFENIMAAISIGIYYNVSESDIDEALSNYQPTNMRSQIKETASNTVLLDAYNANPTSMKTAIQHFGSAQASNKILIVGDMLELGAESENEHKIILQLAAALGFKQIYLIGSNFKSINILAEYPRFDNTTALCAYLKNHPITGSQILVKGSRGIGLEKVMDVL